MARVEPSWWPEAVRLKDTMPLTELAAHLSVTVPVLAAAFRERGVSRRLKVVAPPVVAVPTPEEVAAEAVRTGSKDGQLAALTHLLGRVPDSEIARSAGVSVRTVASYRARNNIIGYDGPRRRPTTRGRRASRVDDFRPLLGVVPDRVVADIASMSLGAIRNFRIKLGVEAAGRMGPRDIDRALETWRSGGAGSSPQPTQRRPKTVPAAARTAWQVVTAAGTYVVIAADLASAVSHALHLAGSEQDVLRIERVGPVRER